MDGDGIDDVAAGVFHDDDGGNGRGSVYVLFLNADRTVKGHQKISSTEGGFTGPLDNVDQMTAGVGLGDLNGDGIPDMVVGAARDDDGGSDRGAFYELFLNRDGTVKAEQKVSQTQGGFGGVLGDGDRFGAGFARLGDLDGDQVTELAVWAPRDNGSGGTWRGAVWILFLRANGTVKDEVKIGDAAGGFPGGLLSDFDVFGLPTAPGDLDGDGVADLVVSAFLDDGTGFDRGALWVLFLNPDGTVKASPPPRRISEGLAGLPLGILDDEDYFGADPAAVGDVDGDGVTDLVVGAQNDDDGTGSDHGAAYVLFLDAAPAVCGNGVLDPLEECDDGGNVSGDLCTASCEVETWLELTGTTSGGGSFEVTVDGNVVVQATSNGETIAEVLTALAASIEAADPDLEAVVSGDVLYTNGSITNVVDNDAGLNVGPAPDFGLPLDFALSFELPGVTSNRLEAFATSVDGFRVATPLGRLRELGWSIPFWSQSSDVTTINTIGTWSISSVALSPASMGGLSRPGPQLANAFGGMRFCLLSSCAPSDKATVPFTGLGAGGVFTTTTAFGPMVVSHGRWTFSTALPSSLGPTTPAVGFMHGPLSNSLTVGRNSGVLQLVAPTRVSSSHPFLGVGDIGFITRLTITIPEPSAPLLLAAGVSLLIGLHKLRRGRREEGH